MKGERKMKDMITGDMPGDKIQIGDSHIKRADAIYPKALEAYTNSHSGKFVISVYGGSGVGKSEIGSLLATSFTKEGIPAYLMSGDNYPFRIPEQNDAERLNRFRYGGMKELATSDQFSGEQMTVLKKVREEERDSDPELVKEHSFFESYYKSGRKALENYLGSCEEIDFDLVNGIISDFKGGADYIALKRMGRTINDIYFEKVDFSQVKVLIIEWTHGNNKALEGIDYPVYLYSTPEETLAHRLSRGRDKGVDSPFTSLVLDIEQNLLSSQADRAALVVSKAGEIIK